MSRTEEEELAVIRDWWQRNGKPLLTGSALALVVVFGWQAWQKHQVSEAQGASVLYQQLLESSLVADGQADVGKVAELAGKLKTDYAGSHYAQYASLLLAKVAVEAGKLDDARAQRPVVKRSASCVLKSPSIGSANDDRKPKMAARPLSELLPVRPKP